MASTIARLATLVVLVLSLGRATPNPYHIPRAQPPSIATRLSRAVSGDLSAAVRVHRGDRSLIVWSLTPLSYYWHALDMDDVPPLARQIQDARWHADGRPARFERLAPVRPLPLVAAPSPSLAKNAARLFP